MLVFGSPSALQRWRHDGAPPLPKPAPRLVPKDHAKIRQEMLKCAIRADLRDARPLMNGGSPSLNGQAGRGVTVEMDCDESLSNGVEISPKQPDNQVPSVDMKRRFGCSDHEVVDIVEDLLEVKGWVEKHTGYKYIVWLMEGSKRENIGLASTLLGTIKDLHSLSMCIVYDYEFEAQFKLWGGLFTSKGACVFSDRGQYFGDIHKMIWSGTINNVAGFCIQCPKTVAVTHGIFCEENGHTLLEVGYIEKRRLLTDFIHVFPGARCPWKLGSMDRVLVGQASCKVDEWTHNLSDSDKAIVLISPKSNRYVAVSAENGMLVCHVSLPKSVVDPFAVILSSAHTDSILEQDPIVLKKLDPADIFKETPLLEEGVTLEPCTSTQSSSANDFKVLSLFNNEPKCELSAIPFDANFSSELEALKQYGVGTK